MLATSAALDRLIVAPVGPGQMRSLPAHGIESYAGARWFPDGRRILFNGRPRADGAAGEGQVRTYVTDVDGAAPQAITPPGVHALALSPDGARLAVRGAGPALSAWPVGGDAASPIAGSEPGDRPVAWSADGGSLWVFQRGRVPADVFRIDLATGRRVTWKTLVPPDPAGVSSINNVRITPRGDAYFYSYRRTISELYLATGLR